MIERDGEEETMRFVRDYYGIPENIKSWKEIDAIAEKEQAAKNKRRQQQPK